MCAAPLRNFRLYFAWLPLVLVGVLGLSQSAGALPSPWLLSFGEISFDSSHVYFRGDQWVGFYSSPHQMMLLAPRDSITVPPPNPVSDSATVGTTVYIAGGAALIKQEAGRKPRTIKLPEQEQAGEPSRLTIHPVTAAGDRIWFGLESTDAGRHTRSAGIGWFDTKRSRFHQILDSSLAGFLPKWIGVAADTANVLMVNSDGDHPQSRLVRGTAGADHLLPFDLSQLRLSDESVRHAAVQGDTLFLTTDTNVLAWWPHSPATIWNTRMYASPEPAPLFWANFSSDSASPDTTRFRLLRYGEPAEIRFWYGDYVEIVTSDDVVALVDDADWRSHQKQWSEPQWNCGDSLCFARLRLPRGGRLVDGQVIHVPISYVGKDDNGIRVSVQAAWARRADLLPVLLPR